MSKGEVARPGRWHHRFGAGAALLLGLVGPPAHASPGGSDGVTRGKSKAKRALRCPEIAWRLGPPEPGRGPSLSGQTLIRRLRPFALPLPKPGPSDWLANHRERGQSFAAYHKRARRKSIQRIVIQPLGELKGRHHRAIGEVAQVLRVWFGATVVVRAPLTLAPHPSYATRGSRGFGPQLHTGYLLYHLKRCNPPASLRRTHSLVVGLVARDVWPGGGWNYLFGIAVPRWRIGVWSMARLGRGATLTRRMLKVATHEVGHVYRLKHCTAHLCGMNGMNHLAELDARPLGFCPVCTAKVVTQRGLDASARFDSLAALMRRVGLRAEAAVFSRQANAIRAVPQ